jgi:hypothetical protein
MRPRYVVPITLLASLLGVAALATPVGAAKKALPDACTAVTKADVTAAFVKLDAALQPTSDVSEPTRSKPQSQGGFGDHACESHMEVPNFVGATVLVSMNPIVKKIGCPPKGQPGKTVKVSGTKVLIEHGPSHPNQTRSVEFTDRGACAFILISLSGGSAVVPPSAFLDLAKAALAK